MLNESLSVVGVPAFADNYLWLIHNGVDAVVVDPGDAAPVLAALREQKLSLAAILLTHHHNDHVGGVAELLRATPGIPVYGPRGEDIATVTVPLAEGGQVDLAQLGLSFAVLDVPGHTAGHIAYVAAKPGWLFCGDTLFAGGCGRLFEGTPAQMSASLAKLAALPEATKVFCAHEYTLSNLRFAGHVEPGNAALQARIVQEHNKRERGEPTVPSTIGLEKSTNPFLRTGQPAIRKSLAEAGKLRQGDEVAAFAALRLWKDSYR